MADALSRIETNALQTNQSSYIDFQEIAAAQQEDPTLIQLQSSPSLKLKAMPVPTADCTIICDTSTGVPRPYIPEKFRHTIFDSLHATSHPSIRATQRLITDRYIWPNINKDVRKWAKNMFTVSEI